MDFRDLNHTLALVCWLTELRAVEPKPVAENGPSQGTMGNPWVWCLELQRRLRTVVTWLDPSEGDVAKISAQVSGSDSILGHADQLATRLAQMKLAASNESTWRQDPTVKTLAATLAKLVLERPKTYDPAEDGGDFDDEVEVSSDPDVQSSRDPYHLDDFVLTLVRNLHQRIKKSGWRFGIRNGSEGSPLEVLSGEDLIAPAGYLPKLMWAAEIRARLQKQPPLWPLRWVRVDGTVKKHWGHRSPFLSYAVSWVVDAELLEGPPDRLSLECVAQEAHWEERVWALIKGLHSSGNSENEVDLTDFFNSLNNPIPFDDLYFDASSRALEKELHYRWERVHGYLCPSGMVILDQTPPPLGKDREENGSDIAKALCKMPMRLAPWPLESTWEALHEEFPWAKATIDRIAMQARFGLRVGQAHFRLPPILLVGQAGCGKTRLAQRLGELCSIPNLTISAAGVLGGQVIQGTDRHWSNTEPSPVLRIIHQHGVANPLIVVDEIDKAAESSHHGSFQAALLPLLEYESARRFMDPCLTVPCDLSAVTWLLTANEITEIGGPLRSRVEIIEMDRPKLDHLEAIVLGVRRDLAKQWRVPEARVPAWDEASSRWVRQQIGPGSLFTAREAKRLIERRLMSTELTPTLTVVR